MFRAPRLTDWKSPPPPPLDAPPWVWEAWNERATRELDAWDRGNRAAIARWVMSTAAGFICLWPLLIALELYLLTYTHPSRHSAFLDGVVLLVDVVFLASALREYAKARRDLQELQ